MSYLQMHALIVLLMLHICCAGELASHIRNGGQQKHAISYRRVTHSTTGPLQSEVVYTRSVRHAPEMGSGGFYGGTFNGGFGSFDTMKRQLLSPHHWHHGFNTGNNNNNLQHQRFRSDWAAGDLHGSLFDSPGPSDDKVKRFHTAFSHGSDRSMFSGDGRLFGANKRRMLGSSGFYDDAFDGGLGVFSTMRKRQQQSPQHLGLRPWPQPLGSADKRGHRMNGDAFHGNLFSGGLGTFDTM